MERENLLSFGVVGFGNIGKRHATIISQFGTLTAVCDPCLSDDDIKQFSGKGVISFYHFDDFIARAELYDVVVICTPNGLHAQQCISALIHEKYVICEKPLALTLNECTVVKNAAIKANRQLIVVKQNRYHKHLQALKQMLEADVLGKIFSVQVNCFWHRGENYYQNSWRGKSLDGGILYTQFSHFFDLLIWYFGPVSESQVMASNFNHTYCQDYEDTVIVNTRFSNGCLASIHATLNAFERNLEGSLLIFSEKATIKVSGPYLNFIECLQGDQSVQTIINEINENHAPHPKITDNHTLLYQHFITAIKENTSLESELDEAILSVELIEDIYKKIKKYH